MAQQSRRRGRPRKHVQGEFRGPCMPRDLLALTTRITLFAEGGCARPGREAWPRGRDTAQRHVETVILDRARALYWHDVSGACSPWPSRVKVRANGATFSSGERSHLPAAENGNGGASTLPS